MAQKLPEHIKILTKKFLNGTISNEETRLLNEWFEYEPQNKPDWILQDESREDLKERLYHNIHREIRAERRSYPLWTKVAVAASVLMFTVAGILWYRTDPALPADHAITFSSSRGQIRKVMLPDRSIVWLKGKSRLDFPARFSDTTRNVTLHGEALFEVSKDRKHPFIIRSGSYTTRVLGTSFNINAMENGGFKLTVLTGKVQVSSPDHQHLRQPVLVTPDRMLAVAGTSSVPVIEPSSVDLKTQAISGTEYPMNFANTGFTEIRHRIEQKFDVKFANGPQEYQQCRISADLTDQSLENSLKVIAAAMGAEYHINGNQITITGGGCN